MVNSQITPDSLLYNILLGNSSSLQIQNINYTGTEHQIGSFKTQYSNHIDITEGVILATGIISNAKGPNNSARITSVLQAPGDSDLARIANNKTKDAAVLEFTFIPEGNHFEFQYVFASEEYPEYVNQGVNDVFAFILTDLKTGKRKNLAVLPNTGEAVTVDNVNSRKNSEFFILNGKWTGKASDFEDDLELGEYALNFQYDGFTTWLKAESHVNPGQLYSLKIAIADAGDGSYDSAVLLKKNSFVSEVEIEEKMKQEKDELVRYFDTEHVMQRNDSLVLILNIHFEYNKFEISDLKDLGNLEEIYHVISRNSKLHLLIEGFTDSRGKIEYNRILSEKRAIAAYDWLLNKGVSSSRIGFIGKGISHPVASNQTENGRAKNRRIEFVFFLEK